MIYWIGYLIFLAFAVFVDYKLFAVVGTENTNKKAIQSMTYWAMITIATMVFIYFGYENDIFQRNQGALLSIGIWSAIILRGVLIIAGLWLINSISWMIFVLGALLIYSGIKIFKSDPDNPDDPNNSFMIKTIRRIFPVTKGYHGKKFVIKKMGKRAMTPLFITLIAIEFTDILFALDSIPAIFAITTDGRVWV